MQAAVRDDARAAALAALAAIRPAVGVVAEGERLAAFEMDAYVQKRETPMAAVLPDTEEQVREIVRSLGRLGVPVVSRGAGTGISGGATPVAGGVMLVLTRMRRIHRIDAPARLATVDPGVPNAQVTLAAEPAGLYFAPDPSSQVVSSIGGN
ncbi:MAG TPA: FAD-binding protein, partial [Usitatibacteraceae bacterium]|nr:FAD-binding protein [Usitatibacteraceae bacterium]